MDFFRKKRIFLDYTSATPVLAEVGREMVKYFSREFYNPSAIYDEGVKVRKEVEEYRKRAAKLVGSGSKEIIFTASGTESVNLAILGAFEAFQEEQKALRQVHGKPHIVVSAIEHQSVMAAALEVARRGGEMSILPVDEHGLVSVEALKGLLKETTFLVSVSLANSEIGTIQPLAKLGRTVKHFRKERGTSYPYLHSDASAAAGFLAVNLESLQSDLLSLDGSKIYGPKGLGLLAVRRGVKIRPIIMGGGQEQGLRAGTSNPALIAGFAVALEIAQKEREKESQRLENIRKHFIESIIKALPNAVINGSAEHRLPSIISVSIPGALSELLVLKLDKKGVMASVGSACSLDERESGSPVIKALGKPELSESTVRFSFGRFTTESDARKAAEIFCRTCAGVVK